MRKREREFRLASNELQNMHVHLNYVCPLCACVFAHTQLHPAVCFKTWHVHKRVSLVREEQ